MRKIFEILRLAHERGWSIRQIAESVGIPHSTAGDYLNRFRSTGLSWPLPEGLEGNALALELPMDRRPVGERTSE